MTGTREKGEKKGKRRGKCVIRSFSFQPDELALLDRGRVKARRYAPDANDSEVVRIALHLLSIADGASVGRAAALLQRVERGRPIIHLREVPTTEDDIFGNAADGHRRLALFDELDKLQRGVRGDEVIEERIRYLCDYFGMFYVPPDLA